MHMKKGRIVIALIILIIIFSTGYYWHRLNSRQWTRAIWILLPNEDESAIEYGWESAYVGDPFGVVHQYFYEGYLIWHRPGEDRKFFVSEQFHKLRYVELRQSLGGRGVFLVEGGKGVVASLDFQSGEFINGYGFPVDWHLSDLQQEDLPRPRQDGLGDYKVKPYPKWDSRFSGTLLAKIDH